MGVTLKELAVLKAKIRRRHLPCRTVPVPSHREEARVPEVAQHAYANNGRRKRKNDMSLFILFISFYQRLRPGEVSQGNILPE